MDHLRPRQVDVRGLSFHLLDANPSVDTGDVMLLLHGGTETSQIWTEYLPGLVAGGWRVVAPDSRGHGGTTNADRRALSYDLMADDMIALMAAVDVRSVVVAGFSDGANIAFEMARRAPSITRGVVLHGLASHGLTATYQHALASFLCAPLDQPADLVALAGTPYGAQLAAWHAAQGADGWRDVVRLVEPLFKDPPALTEADLNAVRCPALVLTGDGDEFMPLEEHLQTFASLPDAELAVWPGVGHAFPTRPALFTELILDFAARRCR